MEVADYGESDGPGGRFWNFQEGEALKGEREKRIGESRGEVSTPAKKLILAFRGEREKSIGERAGESVLASKKN